MLLANVEEQVFLEHLGSFRIRRLDRRDLGAQRLIQPLGEVGVLA